MLCYAHAHLHAHSGADGCGLEMGSRSGNDTWYRFHGVAPHNLIPRLQIWPDIRLLCAARPVPGTWRLMAWTLTPDIQSNDFDL